MTLIIVTILFYLSLASRGTPSASGSVWPQGRVFQSAENAVSNTVQCGFESHGLPKTYFTDGNLSDYSDSFDPGLLEGAQGTLPGNDPDEGFKDRLNGWYDTAEGDTLKDFSYGAESYDAVILAALAAVKGGSTESTAVQENYAAVSGGTDGEECTSYADCVALLEDGSEITYTGPSGIGPINDQNDPSSAFIGIYTYNAENVPEIASVVEGAPQ